MYKDMTDDALRDAYWYCRRLIADMSEARNPRVGRMLRDLDIIVAISRKRGIKL